MISLAGEFTDRKGRHAKGWLFFDSECTFCTRITRWLMPILERRGILTAPLQDPRVGELLGMSRRERLRELRFLLSDGRRYSGADAVIALAREIWWARPVAWLAKLPLVSPLLHAGYRWIASQRRCTVLEIPPTQSRPT